MSSLFSAYLFWDVQTPDVRKHRDFIIARILDEGTAADVQKMFRLYTANEIQDVVINRRGLRPKTVYYWAAYFHLEPRQCNSLKQL